MTDMQEEWSKWYSHNGRRVPSNIRIGDYVQVHSECNATGQMEYGARIICPLALERKNWFWGESTHDTLRYRIKTPRALLELRQLAENVPDEVDA